MAFSGGTFSLVAGNPVVTGTTISSTTNNNTLSDIATNGLSLCILKDGSQTITANIPMSSMKLTGLAAGSTAGDSVRYEQVLLLAGGTMAGNLLFTDATYDIGASGATRPRDLFLSRNAVIGGTLSLGGNVVSNLLFTDATYDIGASGATRPRDLFLSRNAVIGGTLGVTGTLTATGAISAATVTGGMVATQAQEETASATDVVTTPGRQHFHPGMPKCWAHVTVAAGTPTLAASYNITSITDTGTGQLTVTIATDFSSAAWCAMVSVAVDAGYIAHVASSTPQTAGAILLECEDSASTLTDPVQWNFMGLGDLA